MNNLIEISSLFKSIDKPATDTFGVWRWIINQIKDDSPVVDANEWERKYGMAKPILFLLNGQECTVEAGDSFHHPNTSAIVVFNRTQNCVQKKCYRRG